MNETKSPDGTKGRASRAKGHYGRRARQSVGRHLRRNLVTGSLMLVPVALTYLVLRFIFDVTDGVLQPAVKRVTQMFGLELTLPGVGLLVAVILIYFTGFFLANAVGRRMARWAQGAVMHLPLIGTVYSASRRLVESFSGTGDTGFKRVVMLQYPRQDAWTIGFLTAITTALDGKRMAVVYIPTAPTPTSGWVAMVPIEDVWDTDLTVQTAMQAVFSGGIVTPAVIKTRKLELTGILDSPPPEETKKNAN